MANVLMKLLRQTNVFYLTSLTVSVCGLIWGVSFMFMRNLNDIFPLGSAYISSKLALTTFTLLVLAHLVMTIWYMLYFFTVDRLSMFGMYCVSLPILISFSYVSTPPTNILLFFSLELSYMAVIFSHMEWLGIVGVQNKNSK